MSSEVFSRLFSDVDAVLARAEASSVSGVGAGEPVTVEGTAAGERLRVVITGGRLVSVEVAPQLLRLGSAEVGDLVVEAVNSALEAYQAAVMELVEGLSPGLGTVREQVRQIQEESVRSLDAYTGSMLQMLRQARHE